MYATFVLPFFDLPLPLYAKCSTERARGARELGSGRENNTQDSGRAAARLALVLVLLALTLALALAAATVRVRNCVVPVLLGTSFG